MGNDILKTDLTENWKKNLSVAGEMLKTGLLPKNITTPQQVLLIMETGRELGIPPMEALRTIYVVDNKPSLAAQLMLSLIYNSGQLEDMKIESKPTECMVTMKRKGLSSHSETFGETEAKSMGLFYRDNYKKQAKVMYRWRALSACARVVFPDVIGGLYTPEEIEAQVDTQETMGVVAQTATLTDQTEYTKFFENLFETIKTNLSVVETPEDISALRNQYKDEIAKLIEEDKQKVLVELEAKFKALVGTQEPPAEETSTIDEYYFLADNCKTEKELKDWYKSVHAKISKELSMDEFKKLTEYCKTLIKKMQDKK